MKGKRIQDKLLAWVADIRIYPGGIILFGDSHYKMKGEHVREVIDLLKRGDVLLRRYDHYLGSIALPGYWSHAAIYIGANKVIHMLGTGITQEDIITFCRCDDVCIMRCIEEERVSKAVQEAKRQLELGKEYDYDFKDTPDKFYCSELIHYLYDGFKYRKKPKKYIIPNEIRYAHDLHFIWSRTKDT